MNYPVADNMKPTRNILLTLPFLQNTTAYDVEQVDIALAQNMAVLIICMSWVVAGQAVMISIVPYMAIVNGEYWLPAQSLHNFRIP